MKRWIAVSFAILALMFSIVPMANAILIDNGDGTITDQDLGIMWLADANYAMTSGYDADGKMNWDDANTWADTLNYAGHNDWRLPNAMNSDGTDCTSSFCTDSEMVHLFYNELGGTANVSILEISNSNLDLFSNLKDVYWSGTEYLPNTGIAKNVSFANMFGGYQGEEWKRYSLFAWAVRDITASPVPEPSTMLLLGSGLAGLVLWRKRQGREIE